jgi:uncharacterized protein YbaR (Trm112 family)
MSSSFSKIIESIDIHGTGGKFVRKRDPRVSILSIFAAKEISSGLEALLVETTPGVLKGIDEWPQSEGFSVEIEKVEETRPGTASRICLTLSGKRFRTVFFILCESICQAIEAESDARKAITKVHDLLYTWQQFLKKHSPDGLSEQARVGLFGELEILDVLFIKHMNPLSALEGWRGCSKAHQDFQYKAFALEVKTSRAVSPETVHITNVRQLDDENVDSLFLAIVNVEQNPATGTSLQQKINKIRKLLKGRSVELFDEGLQELGFIQGHTRFYESELYTVKSIKHFRVQDGFPRMLCSQIPEGVNGVKYKINISSLSSFEIENKLLVANVKNLIEEAANE